MQEINGFLVVLTSDALTVTLMGVGLGESSCVGAQRCWKVCRCAVVQPAWSAYSGRIGFLDSPTQLSVPPACHF